QVRDEEHAGERRREALERVEEDHGSGETGAERPPDVRAADRAAPVTSNVLPAKEARQPVAPRARPRQVAGHDNGGERHLGILKRREGHGLMPYASSQPSTTA